MQVHSIRSKLIESAALPDLQTMPRVDPVGDATVSDALIDALTKAGGRRAFGILGGAAVPLFSALVARGLEPIHARHESGAVFMALEHELAGGGPGIIFTTTGPGLTNALTGVAAARREGGRIVVLSAATGSDRRGRGAFQESNDLTYAHCGLYSSGGWFDYAIALQSPAELPVVCARLVEGLSRPQGFVAHVALPLAMQVAPADLRSPAPRLFSTRGTPSPELIRACARWLDTPRVVVWLGYGARSAVPEVRALVDALDARVMCSPRAKGLFPESDTRFLGVTGFGGHDRVFERLARIEPQTTLVLGSRLGEFTSFWDERLIRNSRIVHVDTDPTVFGAAYPDVELLGVEAEVSQLLRALLPSLRPRVRPRLPHPVPTADTPVATEPSGRVRPRALMNRLQRIVVEGSEAPVLAEAGNAFLWTTNLLRFDRPGRYRTSMGFGSMGHAAAGVVGAALACDGPAIAVVGDGSMLMSNEVSTAVSLGVPAIWVVLNDGRYGLVADGMQGLGHRPFGLDFHPADFAALGRALGARAYVIEREDDLDDVLHASLQAGGPTVVDVRIDSRERAPFGARNDSLTRQLGGE